MTDRTQHDRILAYASKTERQRKLPLPRRWRVTIAILYFMAAIGLAIYPLMTPEIRHYSPARSLPQIEVLRPEWCIVRTAAVTVGVLLIFIASGILAANRRILLGTVLGIAFSIVGIGCVVAGFQHATVTVRNQITGANGVTYCGVDTSYEKGYELAIGRLVSSGPLYQRVDLLDAAYLGRSPYFTVIRPTTGFSDQGAIYSTSDGRIAACFGSYEGLSCYLVYDWTTGHPSDLQIQSPFLLLNATSSINPTDEAAILASISNAGSPNRIMPTERVLNDALTHPNFGVRASAGRMLKTLRTTGKEPDKSRKFNGEANQ